MRKVKLLKSNDETYTSEDGYVSSGTIEVCEISRGKKIRPSREGIRLSGSKFSISIEKPIEGNRERSRGEIKTDRPKHYQKLIMLGD